MFNPIVIRKYAAILICCFLPTIGFAISVIYYDFWIAIAVMLGISIFATIMANLMLVTPFRAMEEGKGLMVINMDSTGVLSPFLTTIKSPYIEGKFFGKVIKDTFNRGALFRLNVPVQTKTPSITGTNENGNKTLRITLDETSFNAAKFALPNVPVLIYNNQIGSFITKDLLSGIEKDSFAEHQVLYLNRKMEELSSNIRDFARYIVEMLKPKASGWGASKWVMIIIGIIIVILVALFAPQIIKAIQGVMGGTTQAVSNAAGSVPNVQTIK